MVSKRHQPRQLFSTYTKTSISDRTIYDTENRTNHYTTVLTSSTTLLMSLRLPKESNSGVDKRRLSHRAITIVTTSQPLLDRRNKSDSKLIKRQKMPLRKRIVPHQSIHSRRNEKRFAIIPSSYDTSQKIITHPTSYL